MVRHRVVAHFADGRLVKGFTDDAMPNRESFHLVAAEGGEAREIRMADLKGLFFVKDFEGEGGRERVQEGDRAGHGKKIRVVFRDGETLVGHTSGYSPGRVAFVVFPLDVEGNNERVFVSTAAVSDVEFL